MGRQRKNIVILLIFSFTILMTYVARAAEGFAVIELFSSEGCSSCPPADEFISRLTKESEYGAGRIYVLNFHVDYWDYLGWKDIFAQERFTERQRQYARYLGGDSVFTPQVIVNGVASFVGSDETAIRKSILKQIDQAKTCSLEIQVKEKAPNQWQVRYAFSGETLGVLLHIAVVEKEVHRDVQSGENAGNKLVHSQLVRELKSIEAASHGEAIIDVPPDVAISQPQVIAYIQRKNDMKILAAAIGKP